MPKIFEIFGYHVSDRSAEAEKCRRAARCPFMDCECDGGGNRYLSHVHFTGKSELRRFFQDRETVPSGVCSLQLRPDGPPWIVCPRRLLVLARANAGQREHQTHSETLLLKYAGYPSGARLGVWSELKMKYSERCIESVKSFDYTFDYIVMPVGRCSMSDVEAVTGESWEVIKPVLESAGFSLAKRKGDYYVDDFPTGIPTIVEIMTCSTSGGNKERRTTIPMAFEDAILGKPHDAPGVNYRQVWARMVSQLIVKSEVAIAWGGKTFWILQDVLVDYISSSTALNIRQFLAERASEVNMICLSYGDSYKAPNGVVELNEGVLFAGPIRPSGSASAQPSFQDMIRAPIHPPISKLIKLLARRKPTNTIIVP